jgi:hypothetical protein
LKPGDAQRWSADRFASIIEPMSHAWPVHVFACASALACAACQDLSRFTTRNGEAYCGSVTLAREFREGIGAHVDMRVTLDATTLDIGVDPPGHITTFEVTDGSTQPKRLFDEAALRPIAPLANDVLSELQFGAGRVRNVLFAVSPNDTAEESMLAVLSLRSDETIEVRLVRPGRTTGTTSAPETQQPVYGLFTLSKQQGLCGF